MRLIFLDIDGVLATDKCFEKQNHELYAYPFHNECVKVLNEILTETKAEIILTSDWRIMYDYDLEVLDSLFKHNGIIKSPIDTTPDLGNRNNELEFYINKKYENISSFVILDDMKLMVFPNNFVKCDINIGLIEKGIKERAINILIKQ